MYSPKKQQTVMVVEDHPMTRYGIEQIIEQNTGFCVLEQGCGDGAIALAKIKSIQPDIVILDLNLPNKNGVSIIAEASKLNLKTKFIIFSGNISTWTLSQLFYFEHVYGILMKEYLIAEFESTIIQVANGHKYYSNKLKIRENTFNDAYFSLSQLKILTKTEIKILKLTTQHLDTNDIAKALFNSTKTIKKHKSNIVKKLGLQGNNALYEFSIKNTNLINTVY